MEEESNQKARFSCLRVIIIIIVVIVFGFYCLVWMDQHGKREASRRAKCLSNLKQIGLALNQYALDYNGTLPWETGIEPYQALGKLHPVYCSALDVFRCPSSSDNKWDIENAHLLDNKDGAPFIVDACKNNLSYAYSFNRDGNGKGIKGPWTENAPSSLRLAADKYVTYDYSLDPHSKTKPSNHPIKRVWWKYKGGRNVVRLDGSAKWEETIAPSDVDPDTRYPDTSTSPESDQTGADWWSDPPEK